MVKNGARTQFIRGIKTLCTPVYKINDLERRQHLISGIQRLNRVLGAASHNKNLLYTWKYKKNPQLVSSEEFAVLQKVIREYTDSIQLDEAYRIQDQLDPEKKLGKIGLQLFLNCHDNNISHFATLLALNILTQYFQAPTQATLNGIRFGLEKTKQILNENKILNSDKHKIQATVSKLLNNDSTDINTVRKVLDAVDYKLISDDIVRFVKGSKTYDEIEVTKGWRLLTGIKDDNDAYLRSLDIHTKKLVSIDEKMAVLVFDGNLKDANMILPSIQYASGQKKSLLLLINGECKGDALTSIIINNNKNKRQNNPSRVIIMRYDPASFKGIAMQENNMLTEFFKLPNGLASIYSPEYSQFVPSKVSANQFFGSLDSIKATTGEAFWYNEVQWDSTDSSTPLHKTVTVQVGANNELELEQRRSKLDNAVNNILCHGLATGFLPGNGVALVKCVPALSESAFNSENFDYKLGVECVTNALCTPMLNALTNAYGLNNIRATRNVSKTIECDQFNIAYLKQNEQQADLNDLGILEPLDKILKCIDGTKNFIELLTSCSTIVSRVFEKPKKRQQ